MQIITGVRKKSTVEICEFRSGNYFGQRVQLRGAIHSIRSLGKTGFLLVRTYDGVIQCVEEADGEGKKQQAFTQLREGMTVEVTGIVAKEDRAPNGFELREAVFRILSCPAEEAFPLQIGKRRLNSSLESRLKYRPIALRNLRERAVFRIQEGIVRSFREFLYEQHFTEIHTPKLVAGNAEGGANVFQLEYFGKKAFLTQSPQFYKQMMVGVYDRVFETAPVFRAEKHNTIRHLNEYMSLDFEMGYIEGFEDIMEMEVEYFRHLSGFLNKNYAIELTEVCGGLLPEIKEIPAVRFSEAKTLVSEAYGRKIRSPYDLEPEEEHLIGKYFEENYGSPLVFVTHYPSKKRPFYTMDDPDDPKFTCSFDLLFHGMEVTTGGQRIHDYGEQVAKMRARGMDPEEFHDYLMCHKYGIPPHGGLGIGLERLTMALIRAANIRETSLFPRDVTRLHP